MSDKEHPESIKDAKEEKKESAKDEKIKEKKESAKDEKIKEKKESTKEEKTKEKKAESTKEENIKSQDMENKHVGCGKMLADAVAYPITHKDPEENKDRGNWANPVEFILAALGYAVGLGKSWARYAEMKLARPISSLHTGIATARKGGGT